MSDRLAILSILLAADCTVVCVVVNIGSAFILLINGPYEAVLKEVVQDDNQVPKQLVDRLLADRLSSGLRCVARVT